MRGKAFEGVEDVVQGASEYPIWRRNSMAPDEGFAASAIARQLAADDGIEALPDAASAADRALAAVATIACDMPLTLMSSASSSQVHSDQSALKLALAIKNLADGIHRLERRQTDADTIIGVLKQEVRSVEERTISLKHEQMAVVTTVKKALRTTQQQCDYLEVQKCILPEPARNLPSPGKSSRDIEERLHQVEEKVAALLQWQEDEAAKGVEQIVGRGSGDRATEDLKRALHSNCDLLKTLHQSVSQLEEGAGSKAPDHMAVNEVRQLHRDIQENYYSRRELTPLLEDLEAKINCRLREDYVHRVAPHPQGGDALTGLAVSGHRADSSPAARL